MINFFSIKRLFLKLVVMFYCYQNDVVKSHVSIQLDLCFLISEREGFRSQI